MMSEALLQARGLVKVFRTPTGADTIAIDQVDLDLYPGEVVALIGESGSGKTTLGRALLRLLSLDQGSIVFEGEDLLALTSKELRMARRRFQMVFQNQQANLHPRLSVNEMMDESLRLHQAHLDETNRQSMIAELLGKVGLGTHGDRYLASLSGGEQRRVGLARILATSPKLVVADEPTSGLDAAIKLQTIELLKELKGESLTYLLISHDLGLVRRIADRVLVMLRGRIIEEIAIADLGKIKHHPYTQKLLQAASLERQRRTENQDEHHTDDSSIHQASIDDVKGGEIGCHYCLLCPILKRQPGLNNQCSSTRPFLGHGVACFPLSEARGES
jgi:oligopeptide transport system ATP-binding protein